MTHSRGVKRNQLLNVTHHFVRQHVRVSFCCTFFQRSFVRMETILEQQRRLHEERERLMDGIVKETLHKRGSVSNQLSKWRFYIPAALFTSDSFVYTLLASIYLLPAHMGIKIPTAVPTYLSTPHTGKDFSLVLIILAA